MATEQFQSAGGASRPPLDQAFQTTFDNGIWYILSMWSILHIAIANEWGGPDSADKRDWFAGAVSDLFNSRSDTNQDDVEIFLLQIMQDEFDVNVEDESEVEIARSIVALRNSLEERDISLAQDLEGRWKSRGKQRTEVQVAERNQEVDDDEDYDSLDGDGDVQMEESADHTQAPAKPREKLEPEIDEDGFTKVVGKKKNR